MSKNNGRTNKEDVKTKCTAVRTRTYQNNNTNTKHYDENKMQTATVNNCSDGRMDRDKDRKSEGRRIESHQGHETDKRKKIGYNTIRH